MSADDFDIDKLAKLAQLGLSDDTRAALTDKMAHTISMIKRLDALDTTNVLPLAHPFDQGQPLREDVVCDTNERDAFQAIAPDTRDGLYLVPQVIE